MVHEGLRVYLANPSHKLSVLVTLSDDGITAYSHLREVQDPWAINTTADIPTEELDTALRLVRRLIQKFDR